MSEAFGKIREAMSSSGVSGVLAEVGVENLATLLAKNADYGSSGLTEPILFPGLNARQALLVRMSDKISRIQTLQNKGPEVSESLEDTMLDLANYCLLWVAVPQLAGAIDPGAEPEPERPKQQPAETETKQKQKPRMVTWRLCSRAGWSVWHPSGEIPAGMVPLEAQTEPLETIQQLPEGEAP